MKPIVKFFAGYGIAAFVFAVARILAGMFLMLLVLASPARAQDHPLRDSLAWSIPLVASSTFDRQTSIAWSSHPSTCIEGNASRRNQDGTLDAWKATKDDALQTAVLVGALYGTKRLHWKVAEKVMKVVILGRSAEYTYRGVQSLRNCQVVR